MLRWIDREHGELDFHLTLVRSGHGCFEVYLYKIGKRTSAVCVNCERGEDTERYKLFVCSNWSLKKQEAWSALGMSQTSDSLVNIMLEEEKK